MVKYLRKFQTTRWFSPDGVVARPPGWRMGGFGYGRRGPTRAGRSHETRAGLGDRLLKPYKIPKSEDMVRPGRGFVARPKYSHISLYVRSPVHSPQAPLPEGL